MADPSKVRQSTRGHANQVAGTVEGGLHQMRQVVDGTANQTAGRDFINIEHLTIINEHRSTNMTDAAFDPDFPYRMSEEQHTCLYRAKHLLAVLDGLAMASNHSDHAVDIPRESLAVVFGLARDLVEKGTPKDGSRTQLAQ